MTTTVTGASSSRRRTRRGWRLAELVAAALLLIGAFLLWGPIGLGNGPLAVDMATTEGGVDQNAAPVAFILPMYNSGGGVAVVDAVDLIGGTRFPGPHLLSLAVVSTAACGGAWPARADGGGFAMDCGGGYHGSLIGRDVPNVQGISPGFPAAAEVAAPRPGSCWVLTGVVVHYHVGTRHYAASDPFELAVCASNAIRQVKAAMTAAESVGG